MDGEYNFDKGEAGALLIKREEAGSLHKGDFVMVKEHPCKIVNLTTAKVGKHGSCKVILSGVDIFTSRRYDTTFGSSDMIEVPVIDRLEFQLTDIDTEGYVSMLGEDL